MDAKALGRYLRESREAKELTLDDVESALRIRRYFLDSFERGQFEFEESSAVQIRGFLRNYASYLDLDPDLVIEYYKSTYLEPKSGKGKPLAGTVDPFVPTDDFPKVPKAPREITDTPTVLPVVEVIPAKETPQQGRSILRSLMLLIVFIILLGGGIFLGATYGPDVLEQLNATDSDSSNMPVTEDIVLDATEEPLDAEIPAPPTEESMDEITPSQFDGDGILITLNIVQRSWLRTVVDGEEEFTGQVAPGDMLEFEGTELIEMTSSNGVAFELVYNGQPQQIFSARGQELTIRFTPADYEVTAETLPVVPTATEEVTEPESNDESAVETEAATLTPVQGITPTISSDASEENSGELNPLALLTPGERETIIIPEKVQETPIATVTVAASPTPINTPGPSPTPTTTVIATATPSETETPEITATETVVPSESPFPTDTPAASTTPTATSTNTGTPTITPTQTPEITNTPTPNLPLRATRTDATPSKSSD